MSACLFSSKADEQQQKAQAPAKADVASTSAGTSVATATTRPKAAEEWTEVIDEKSGQTYYWNEKTGAAVLHISWNQAGGVGSLHQQHTNRVATLAIPCCMCFMTAVCRNQGLQYVECVGKWGASSGAKTECTVTGCLQRCVQACLYVLSHEAHPAKTL
jgi:hypothetical protein